MKSSMRLGLGAAICAAILLIGASSFLPILVQADTDAEKAIKKAEAETAKAEKAAKEAAEAQKAADEAGKKAGKEQTPEDKAADDAAKAAAEAAEKADEAQDKAQEEQLEAEDAAKAAKEAGGSNEEKNQEAADEKKQADDAAEAAKKAEEDVAKKEKEADAADKKADDADKKRADARLRRKRARAARRAAAKAIRDARRLLHEATRTGKGSETKPRKKRLDDLAERLKLIRVVEDARQTEDPPKKGNFIPAGDDQNAESKTANGLQTVTFKVVQGRVIVRLPDDMRAGDTISGTVITEPKGETPEERAKNQNVLGGLAIEIDGKRVEPFSGAPEKEREAVIQQTFWIYTTTLSGNGGSVPIALTDRDGQTLAQTTVLIGQMFDDIRKAAEGLTPSGAVITPDPKITQPPFSFPPVGQTGRPIVITGPFDGNGANTAVRIGDWEDRDNTGRFDLIAESPRKAVFNAPANVIGPVTLHLTEGNIRTTGNYRNVGVNLSAPKTNLTKGEQTVLKVEVSGLEGITKPVPLQLDATGVIKMDEGNFQSLRITPSEVNQGGRYTTTRAITGQQAGGFTVVATVVVSRFDVCLSDDSVPLRVVRWSTFTGEYIVTPPPAIQTGTADGETGGPVQRGVAALKMNKPCPTGEKCYGCTVYSVAGPNVTCNKVGNTCTIDGIPGTLDLEIGGSGACIAKARVGSISVDSPQASTGWDKRFSTLATGTLTRKGCIITLTHNAPDRRVFARLDTCTKAGDATVQTTSPQTHVKITDTNVTDNTCPSE